MGKIKLKFAVEDKNKFKSIQLSPTRSFLLDSNKYAGVWNNIIARLIDDNRTVEVFVVLTMNLFLLHEEDLYEKLLINIENGNYKVLAQKIYPSHKIKRNFEEIDFSEHKYLLSVKSDDLKFLVEKLSDKDALRILIAKSKIPQNEYGKFLENKVCDMNHDLKYMIYFNGIHIGLGIEMYNGNTSLIGRILTELEDKGLCVIKEEN